MQNSYLIIVIYVFLSWDYFSYFHWKGSKVSVIQILNLILHYFRCSTYSLDTESWTKGFGQIDKTKQNRFFMECFTADFLQDFTKKHQILPFGLSAKYLPSNPNISEIFL